MSVYEIIEYFGEFKPIPCEKCSDWFECGAIAEHQKNCEVVSGSAVTGGAEEEIDMIEMNGGVTEVTA